MPIALPALIKIEEGGIYIPNAFTLNGDGIKNHKKTSITNP